MKPTTYRLQNCCGNCLHVFRHEEHGNDFFCSLNVPETAWETWKDCHEVIAIGICNEWNPDWNLIANCLHDELEKCRILSKPSSGNWTEIIDTETGERSWLPTELCNQRFSAALHQRGIEDDQNNLRAEN